MNEHEIKIELSKHGLSWESFAVWIESEPRPDDGSYYPKDIDRFIYWNTKSKTDHGFK